MNYSIDSSVNLTMNFTADLYVPVDLSARVKYILGQPYQIIMLILSFLAIALNILSILAILRIHYTLTSHYRFIVSLAISDILIGVTWLAHNINNAVNPRVPTRIGPWDVRVRSICAFMFIKALNTTSLNITLLNLMGMAIDHFLAILRPLHYPTLMNKQKATCLIITFWVVAIICGFSDFLSVYPMYSQYLGKYTYCELAWENPYQEEYTMFVIAICCVIVMTFTYTRMFLAVKQRHQHVGPVRQEMQHNKKALFTTLLILGTFIGCWLPLCLFQIILIIQVKVNKDALSQDMVVALLKADKYLYVPLVLNAIFDPVIYAIRMREVRFGYRRLFWLCCRHVYKDNRYSTDTTHSSMIVTDHSRFKRLSTNSIRMLERSKTSGQALLQNNSSRQAKTVV